MANLEESAEWGSMVAAMQESPIVEVAKKFGVRAGDIASALVRTQVSRKVIQPGVRRRRPAEKAPPAPQITRADDEQELPPEAGEPSEASEGEAEADEDRGDRSSKLDPHRDLVGSIPDAAVASQVGMSIQAVRNYRQKHGIAASGRRRTRAEVEAARNASPSTGGAWAWKIGFEGSVYRVLLANNIAAAAARASAAGLGEVTSIDRLGEAL